MGHPQFSCACLPSERSYATLDLCGRLSHPPSKRCAKSYDVLRLDLSVPACGLLSSHDDFSVVDNLPEDAAVITQVRMLLQP